MKCEHCREWLDQYIDFELSAEESAWVEEHLSICTECRDEYNALVYTKKACVDIPDYLPPKDFTNAWKAEVMAEMGYSGTDSQQQVTQPVGAMPSTSEKPEINVVPIPKKSGMSKVVRGIAAAAAVVLIGIMSVQGIRMLSTASDEPDNAAYDAPANTDEQRAAVETYGNEGKVFSITPTPAAIIDNVEEITASPEVEVTEDIDIQQPIPEVQETGRADADAGIGAGTGEEQLPQPTQPQVTAPPDDMAKAELEPPVNNTGEAAIVSGEKDIYVAPPIDREFVDSMLVKHGVDAKWYQERYIIVVDQRNVKAVNRLVREFDSNTEVFAGETVYIMFR